MLACLCAWGSTTIYGSIASWRRPANPRSAAAAPAMSMPPGIAVLELGGMSVAPGDGHAHGSGNPHYWLDPKNAEFITANILAGLARIDPAHASTYEANRDAFLARLGQKIGEWDKQLAPLRSMPIIAYHNSWPYFARRFRLDFAGFLEIKPGVPPTPSHLADIIHVMRDVAC